SWPRDWSSDVCSSDLGRGAGLVQYLHPVADHRARVGLHGALEEALAVVDLEARTHEAGVQEAEGAEQRVRGAGAELALVEHRRRSEERRVGKEGRCGR